MFFSLVVHLDTESCPAVNKEGIGVVVLMPEDVRYPFYWVLLKRRPRGGDQVKMRRRRLGDVVDVGKINQSGETVAPKVNGPSGDVMKCTSLANHGSDAKDSGHFAAVQTLYVVAPGTIFTPLHRLSFDAAAGGMSSPVHR
jgi:hypothetical protein